MRKVKSFSLDQDVVRYISRTKAGRSESERVNQLLKTAIQQEELAELAREAEEFFSTEPAAARKESRAFYKLARRSLFRD